jgi:hypothetical protein
MFQIALKTVPAMDKKRFLIHNLCAAETSDDPKSEEEWILTRIVDYIPKANMVHVRDDDDLEKKLYILPEQKVLPLGHGQVKDWTVLVAGDKVLALYPNTTTFYPAEIVGCDSLTGIYRMRFEGDDIDEEDGLLVVKEVPYNFIASRLSGK